MWVALLCFLSISCSYAVDIEKCIDCTLDGNYYCYGMQSSDQEFCSSSGKTQADCDYVDQDGIKATYTNQAKNCIPGGCGGLEYCEDCAKPLYSRVCGWCHRESTGCIPYADNAGVINNGGACDAAGDDSVFTIGTCERPCAARITCDDCVEGDCKYCSTDGGDTGECKTVAAAGTDNTCKADSEITCPVPPAGGNCTSLSTTNSYSCKHALIVSIRTCCSSHR